MHDPAEHEIVTHLYHVKIPYHMDPLEMNFEPNLQRYTDLPSAFVDLCEFKDDEVRRVLAGAVLLLEKFPHRSIEEALETAMVWERG